MIGVVVAAHGNLAAALVSTVAWVAEDLSHVIPVAIGERDDAPTFLERFLGAVKEAGKNRDGVIILTDMFGGTPSTIGMTLFEHGKIEILTGVNLPMLIKVVSQMNQELDVIAVAQKARASAMQAITMASVMLASHAPEE